MPSFRDIAPRWLKENSGAVNQKTIDHYRWLLERYVYPSFGDSLEITGEEVEAFVASMLERGLSEYTVFILPKLIYRVLSFASSEGLCALPEWDPGRRKPQRKRPAIILSSSQEQQLLLWLTEHPDPKNLALYLILTTGIGIGEVLQLTWADISFPLSRIRVLTEKETTPDTRNKFRYISINERQKLFLKKLTSLPTCYVASGKPRPFITVALRDRLVRVCKEMMLPEISLSDLRRTYAVHALEKGMGYTQLSKVLGQKDNKEFRAIFREIVSPETRERLEKELEESRKVRQAPKSIRPPEKNPEIRALEEKIEAKRKELKATLDNLDGDLQIIRALRNSDGVQGVAREGFYRFVETVLGDDRDGKMLVEYLRCNMRIASMPSRKDVAVQTIRARISRGFGKLCKWIEKAPSLQ